MNLHPPATDAVPLTDYQVFISDDRYSVRTFYIVQATSGARAVELATRLLRESPHHLGVEVFNDGGRIFMLGTIGSATSGETEEGAHSAMQWPREAI